MVSVSTICEQSVCVFSRRCFKKCQKRMKLLKGQEEFIPLVLLCIIGEERTCVDEVHLKYFFHGESRDRYILKCAKDFDKKKFHEVLFYS